ncbi:hypothetical protein [Streptomyces sp. NBC_00059]|uniref:hypothetical protein n=1 Tax=Streptomyces sp. NBC_00059 TaxID=2975635 RepID=UPI0022597003|nr:hypothetical protein [Streptomyces sp. NBC_00059]MCX5415421.1 hypothetical protein [Streptomyces sp. NBC_00059]
MSTTRHLVNRRRRLATVAAATAPPRTATAPVEETETGAPEAADPPRAEEEPAAEEKDAPPRKRLPRLRIRLPAVLCAATLLLGAFAAWSFTSAGTLRDDPGRQNTALTDIGRTSEVKGQITEAVGAVFSYDYASPEKADLAARKYLTGKAVQQHGDMLAEVRAQAPKQKLVLTTTVTQSGVEVLDGDRARLLVFADQSNTRTGKEEETTYAAAMFAVDAVRRGDTWRIAAIDTFAR